MNRVILLVTALLVATCAQAQVGGYAKVKERNRICADCSQDRVSRHAFVVPKRGLIFSRGNIFNTYGSAVIVDLEKQQLSTVVTSADRARGEKEPTLKERNDVQLSDNDVAEIIHVANRVWASPRLLRSTFTADMNWNLTLVDGELMREEAQSGTPEGLALLLYNTLKDIAKQYAVQPTPASH